MTTIYNIGVTPPPLSDSATPSAACAVPQQPAALASDQYTSQTKRKPSLLKGLGLFFGPMAANAAILFKLHPKMLDFSGDIMIDGFKQAVKKNPKTAALFAALSGVGLVSQIAGAKEIFSAIKQK